MATKYLIGSGDFNSDLIWSTESGGVNNTTHPTKSDDVVCDIASGNVTLSSGSSDAHFKSINAETFTGRFNSNTSFYFNSYGNITLGANMLQSTVDGYWRVRNTTNIKTNGFILNNLNLLIYNDSTVNLLDNFQGNRFGFYNGGVLNTNNYSISVREISNSVAGNKILNAGSSIITTSIFNNSLNNITINGENYKFIINQASTGNMSFSHGNVQFYDLELNGYNDANSVKAFAGDLVCNNSLKLAGKASNKKLWVKSATPGTVRTITAPSVIVENCDFTDIKGAGDGWPSAVKNLYNSSLKWSSNCRYNGVQR